MSAISAIDIALWDIRSKVTKLPLYQLLGGYRESIPFYIAGGYYGPDKGIPELQKEMEQYVSWGAKAVKMTFISAVTVYDKGKGIHLFLVDQNIQLHQIRLLIALHFIVKGRIAPGSGLQGIKEVINDLI